MKLQLWQRIHCCRSFVDSRYHTISTSPPRISRSRLESWLNFRSVWKYHKLIVWVSWVNWRRRQRQISSSFRTYVNFFYSRNDEFDDSKRKHNRFRLLFLSSLRQSKSFRVKDTTFLTLLPIRRQQRKKMHSKDILVCWEARWIPYSERETVIDELPYVSISISHTLTRTLKKTQFNRDP